MINKEKEKELWKEWKKTNDPKKLTELLNSLDPLITKEVNVYSNAPISTSTLKLEALSLAKTALDTYNPNKSQLNTHVTNYLRKLNRFVGTYQNIGKIPEHRILMIADYKTTKENLQDKLGREPNAMEIANEMKLPLKEIERLETELRKDLSITDELINEDGKSSFLEPVTLSDKTKEAIEFVYYSLTDPTEKRMMELYFGLFGNMKTSIPMIAQQLNIPYNKLLKRLKEIGELIVETEKNLI